ncbi:MobH family relaxase [Hydrogenophaga crassostreae]|nr:MobH family relaxase [Hydrogenophaga crassostreae]
MIRGSSEGWLRILRAEELFTLVQSGKAMEAMWRQSRLSAQVWQRDLRPALLRYAEYVQLLPASESHHHAHVGGLLAHTLETTLAAMTWRNGHFFPEGAAVEEMDAQRDEWTYVVFFAALLHDIGKIMTDLRISWSCMGIDAPLRWVPMSGPLTEMAQKRSGGEYLVEFTPKSARDYQAHSKLSMVLLQQIAPPSALSFLARRPQAFEALSNYLSGADKTSLLATLVRKADQTSTQHALAGGSRARFSTSTSVPLIDLLMQSIKDMLRNGTALPLNRSGAAGWVYDGAIWFVAKRLADGVRQHIKQYHPEEAIPGENKNDRLFDTWQEYGCIQLNPDTGQAVWYVQVHGGGADEDCGSTAEEGGATYSHSLTVLRFPLDRLFADPAQYPSSMVGHIEVQQRRRSAGINVEDNDDVGHHAKATSQPEPVPTEKGAQEPAPKQPTEPTLDPVKTGATSAPFAAGPRKGNMNRDESALRAPKFTSPKAATVLISTGGGKAPTQTIKKPAGKPAAPPQQAKPVASDVEPLQMGGVDGFSAQERWLDFEDDAAIFKQVPTPPSQPAPRPATTSKSVPAAPPVAPIATSQAKAAAKLDLGGPASKSPSLPPMPAPIDKRPLLVRSGLPSMTARSDAVPVSRIKHTPVVISMFLPDLPHESADKQVEPTAVAMAFIAWLQQGLGSRSLKYNEAGAMIHFTAEGMALVSPLVFKAYVADQDTGNDSDGNAQAMQVQREVIKAGWHLMGPGKSNILKYEVIGRGNVPVGKLSAVVLTNPDRWVLPVPPNNPVIRLS